MKLFLRRGFLSRTSHAPPPFLLLAVLTIPPPPPGDPPAASEGSWTYTGPHQAGGDVRAIAIDPASTSTLYAATASGVFKSTNGGRGWSPANSGLGADVRSLAIDPTRPSTIYAATDLGIFRSNDGARSWTARNTGLANRDVRTLAVDPQNPLTVHAGTHGGGLFQTSTGGEIWAPASTGLVSRYLVSIAIDPTSPSTLYVGTADYVAAGIPESGLFKSTDGGTRWTKANKGLTAGATSLAIDPSSPLTIYASTRNGPFKSTDGGESWRPINAGLGAPSFVSVLVLDRASPSMIYAARRGAVFQSTDGGASWREIRSGLPNLLIRALAIDPVSPSILYAGTQGQGVFKTERAGATWTATESLFEGIWVSQLAVHSGLPSTVLAASDNGVFRSADRAETWTPVPGFTNTGVSALAIAPSAPSLVYAGGYSKTRLLPGPYPPIVFRSTDGGANWTGIATIPARGTIAVLAVHPALSSTLYAGTPDGLFKSEDGGLTWSGPRLTGLSVLTVNFHPFSPSTLFAGTSGGLFKSVNGGAEWSLLHRLEYYSVASIAIDPGSPTTIYAGLLYGGPSPCCTPLMGRLIRSADAGQTWTDLNIAPFWYAIFALVIDPTFPSVLYAGTSAGVFRSTDRGATWTVVAGLTAQSVRQLALALPPSSTLYAATGIGVFKNSELDKAGCTGGPTALCLNGDRFRVEVSWRTPENAGGGNGRAVPLTPNSGAFWFFNDSNIELVVKILDARTVNRHFWVFYGALSHVEYVVTVTDTQTGAVKTYFNRQGQLASFADTRAF